MRVKTEIEPGVVDRRFRIELINAIRLAVGSWSARIESVSARVTPGRCRMTIRCASGTHQRFDEMAPDAERACAAALARLAMWIRIERGPRQEAGRSSASGSLAGSSALSRL